MYVCMYDAAPTAAVTVSATAMLAAVPPAQPSPVQLGASSTSKVGRLSS